VVANGVKKVDEKYLARRRGDIGVGSYTEEDREVYVAAMNNV